MHDGRAMDAVRWDRVTFSTHMVEAAAVVGECQVAFDFEGQEQVCYEVKVFRAEGASARPYFAVATNHVIRAFRPWAGAPPGRARRLSRHGRHPPPTTYQTGRRLGAGIGSRAAPAGGHRRARPLKRMTFP
jgi:hypothetical protein